MTDDNSAQRLEAFQSRVQPWLMACFGEMIAGDREERNHRFLEEALELVQACGCSASEAHQLVDYVFGRPVGELHQEVGGVMVTLAALCLANDADMHAAGWVELDRIWGKVEAIRAKQAAKPKHSPLPMTVEPGSASGEREAVRAMVALDEGIEAQHPGWMTGHINREAEAVAMHKHSNCPACGGSGHIDDVAPAAVDEARDVGEDNARIVEAVRKVSAGEVGQYVLGVVDDGFLPRPVVVISSESIPAFLASRNITGGV